MKTLDTSLFYSCIVDHKDFHRIGFKEEPFNYCIFNIPNSKPLVAPPVYNVIPIGIEPPSGKKPSKFILIRGDHESKMVVWNIPDVTNSQISQLKQMAFGEHITESEESRKKSNSNFLPPEVPPKSVSSLQQAWDNLKPSPPGILDQFVSIRLKRFKRVAKPKLQNCLFILKSNLTQI